MKKIYLYLLKILNLKTLALIRTLISYNKEGAYEMLKNDDLNVYDEHKIYFSELLLPDNKKTIMDFGCGTGRYLNILKNFQVVYLVDISMHNLQLASNKAKSLNINHKLKRRSLSFLNIKVDYFFSVGVFGQFYQFDAKVLKKIYSIINTNGKAVFTVKVKDEITDEILAVEEDKILELLNNYKYKVYKKYFSGVNNKSDYFYVIELFK
tara:strand:+ start:855 stop:1481 length:627 start_codon:yes stop_codon:yes gene_type:complete